MDWAKNSEDKVTVSKSILSSGLSGRQHSQDSIFPHFLRVVPFVCLVFKSSSRSAGFAHKSLDIEALISANKAFKYGLTRVQTKLLTKIQGQV